MLRTDKGQISIDFIAGVGIFMVTFMFVAQFIPGMLIPFQSTSDELTIMADRVSTILVEDYLVNNPSRPNVVSATELDNFLEYDLNSTNYFSTLKKLGLVSSIQSYNLNVTVKYSNGRTISAGGTPPDFANIARTVRFILIVYAPYNLTVADHVVIDEVMYDGVTDLGWDGDSEEYFILHNPTASTVDISGWVIEDGPKGGTGGATITFPSGTYIDPNDRLLIARDSIRFQANALPGCEPDFEYDPAVDDPDVPDMEKAGGDIVALIDRINCAGGDEGIYLATSGAALVDAVVWCDGVAAWLPGGETWDGLTVAPNTLELESIKRVTSGWESNETAENEEDLDTTFEVDTQPSCPPRATALLSVMVW